MIRLDVVGVSKGRAVACSGSIEMTRSARVSTNRPEITWMIPYRHTWRHWNREFRGGLRIPRLIGAIWLVLARFFLDVMRAPAGATSVLGIVGTFVAIVYWRFPEADLDFAFWVLNIAHAGLHFVAFGSLVMGVFMLMPLMPGGVSIYSDRVECSLHTYERPPRCVMLDQVESARVIIETVHGRVEHTLWLVTAEMASSFPLDPQVSHDKLRECLRCEVTFDDRRNSPC